MFFISWMCQMLRLFKNWKIRLLPFHLIMDGLAMKTRINQKLLQTKLLNKLQTLKSIQVAWPKTLLYQTQHQTQAQANPKDHHSMKLYGSVIKSLNKLTNKLTLNESFSSPTVMFLAVNQKWHCSEHKILKLQVLTLNCFVCQISPR